MEENEIQSILKVNKTSQARGVMDKKLFSLKDYFFSSAVFKRRLEETLSNQSQAAKRVNLFTHLCFTHKMSCYRWVPNQHVFAFTVLCIFFFVVFFVTHEHMYLYVYVYCFCKVQCERDFVV